MTAPAQPTPGPWKVADEPLDDNRLTVFSLTDEIIAPAVAGGDTPEKRDANARLISRAPELLAFVEDVERLINETSTQIEGCADLDVIRRQRGIALQIIKERTTALLAEIRGAR